MALIYKISNDVNDKVYIGKTLYAIERRWSQHLNNVKKLPYLWHLPIYAAMRYHGIDHFTISQVEEVADYKNLSDREQYWISYYDSYQNGYNATRGGDGSLLYDYDWIWELWNNNYTIKEISKEVGCNDFVVRTVLTLYNISTEERKNRSLPNWEKSFKPYSRKVYQIDINSNEIIKVFDSVGAAAKSLNCDSSNLSKACRAQRKAYGYLWRYDENDEYLKKDFSSKPVCKIDLITGEILDVFPSISAAARSVNGDSSYIGKVCRGIQKSSHGFGWEYLNLNY